MIKTIKAIDLSKNYSHPKISVVTYLYMREIVFQTYSLEQVLETLESILQRLPKHLED